jgi:hypothetical protein
MARRRRRTPRGHPWWARLPLEELLDVRLRELHLRWEESPLAPRVAQLHDELEARGLRFRPHVWLSTQWFSPSGVPGFAIPFFLAHPRLRRLELSQMLEVEGGSPGHCLRLLRHETGHALDHAYRLSLRRGWRQHFGSPSAPYRATYVPRPASRRYVLNLPNWYAQSHPVEDFAETFAVWLAPRSAWRRRYAGTGALPKLLYVDDLMREIADRPVRVRSQERTDSIAQLRITLRDYYRRKQAHYGVEDRSVYDRDLLRLFSADPAQGRRRLASSFLRERRRELREQVSKWTGQHAFVVDQVLQDMIVRCRDLRLRLAYPTRETTEGTAVLVTVHCVRLMRRRRLEYSR